MMQKNKNHPSNFYKFCPKCQSEGVFDIENLAFECSQCGFAFFLNSAAAVTALICNETGEYLFTRRGIEPAFGMLDFPGGFVDPGESAEMALTREIKEELDLNVVLLEYYGSFPNRYEFSGTTVHTTDFVFKCKVEDFKTLTYQDDIKGVEFRTIESINIEDEIPFDSVKNLIKSLRCEE